MYVDLGGADGAVAQELLHLVNAPARLHQRRGVGVAQLVGGDAVPVPEARPPGHPLHHGLHGAGGEGLAPVLARGVAPDVGARGVALQVPVLEPLVEGPLGRGGEDHHPLLVPLAPDPEGVGDAVLVGDVGVGEPQGLGEAEAGAVEEG